MSESHQPKKHPCVEVIEGGVILLKCIKETTHILDADEAVALGFALFEQGLALKGRMKNAEG